MAAVDMFRLDGRVALVTGASSGIGAVAAGALAAAGAAVVATGRDVGRLTAVVDGILADGGTATAVAGDLGTRDDVALLADAFTAPYGAPDILVTAAAVNDRPPLADVDWDVWDRQMRTNVDVPFALGQLFGPQMVRRGWGRVIHFASQQAMRAFGNSGAYGVSKSAVTGLTRSQAEAWSPYGVTVNAITPGFVRTRMTEHLFADEPAVQALADRTLVGRNGVPEDYAGVTVFLASDASAYLTGQVLAVDGGFSVH